MYKSLQHFIPGNVKDPSDLHIWKLDYEYLGDDWVTTVSCIGVHCSAGLKVTDGPDYILIARCGIHNKNSHNSESPHDGNIFLKISCLCDLIRPFC
jgi:hypothetical protein